MVRGGIFVRGIERGGGVRSLKMVVGVFFFDVVVVVVSPHRKKFSMFENESDGGGSGWREWGARM